MLTSTPFFFRTITPIKTYISWFKKGLFPSAVRQEAAQVLKNVLQHGKLEWDQE